MVLTIINSDVNKASIVLIAANFDKTSSFGKGANRGPEIIKNSLDFQIELKERYTGITPTNSCKIAYLSMGDQNKLSSEKMVSQLKDQCLKLLKEKRFIITIGGEHSITNGPIQAIAEFSKQKISDITIVQFDAHFDLRIDDSDYSEKPSGKYAHCAVMRRASESGFNLVQVGIRAYSEDEMDYALKNKNSIKFFEWGKSKDMTELFVEPRLDEIIKSIKTKNVYLSIDVDGFDPSVMPETGTPVPGGFNWDYGVKLINKIFMEKNVIGADIVEVAPKNKESYSAYNAAQLVHNMIALHALKNK